MAIKAKERTTTGVTNKASSKDNLAKPKAAAPQKQCVCGVCTCGRHRCTGTNYSNVSSVGGGAKVSIDTHTECRDQFIPRELTSVKSYKPEAHLPPNLPLETSTVTRTEYIERPIPPRYPPHENKYIPNPNPIEDLSENHEKFKRWPATQPPSKFKISAASPSAGPLQGDSVTKTDYADHGYVPRVQPYKKVENIEMPNADLLNTSLYTDEYPAYQKNEFHVPQKHILPPSEHATENRDFVSTTKTSYKPHEAKDIKPPGKHIQKYTPNPASFEGASIQKTDFIPKQIDTSNKGVDKHCAIVARAGTFQLSHGADEFHGSTEYSQRFVEKPITSIPTRLSHKNASHAHPELPLEGECHLQEHYKNPALIGGGSKVYERVNFKPIEKPRDGADERDFGTTTKSGFTAKDVHVCPVIQRANVSKNQGQDGHMYFEGKTVGAAM